MGKLLLGTLCLALLGAACATTATGVAEQARTDGRQAGIDGQTLYEQSCQRCHALYMPSSFHADEWRFFVRKYGRKARLTAEEKAKVFDYLSRNAGT